MSHQSLEDLVNVSGSPADGKILKYNSGAWGPADESGGGSSGAEYLEIFKKGDSTSTGALLFDAGGTNTEVLHNSIPVASVFKKADAPSGIGFHSNNFGQSTYDNVYFIKQNTGNYLCEVTYLVLFSGSSISLKAMQYGYMPSNQSDSNFNATGLYDEPTFGNTFTYASPNSSRAGVTGTVQWIKNAFIVDSSNISGQGSDDAFALAVYRGSNGWSSYYFPCPIFNQTATVSVLRKHTRLTKIP